MTKLSKLVLPLLALAAAASACDDDLSRALEDVRSAMPDVCKEYCEDKVYCEWPATVISDLEKEAYSTQVQRCEVACAVEMSRGAYVAQNALEGIDYVGHVSGGALEDALTCAIDSALYSCPDGVHTFGGLVQSQCATAEECLSELDIDLHLAWTPTTDGGGTCAWSGSQWVDSAFF